MTNAQLTLIIIALLAIIPAGVVFLSLFSRLISHERRIEDALGGKEDINRLEQSYKDLYTEIEKIKTKQCGLDESFIAMTNRVNARSRWENRTKPEKEQEPKEEKEPEFELPPGMPPVFPLDRPQPSNGGQMQKMVLRKKSL